MPQNQTILNLFLHVWKILRKWSFSEWRMTRWEYWIAILVLSLAMTIVSVILWWLAAIVLYILNEWMLLNGIFVFLTTVVWIILPIAVTILQIKLVIKRCHDLNKNGRYAYWPWIVLWLSVIIFVGIARKIGLITATDPNEIVTIVSSLQSNVLVWIVGIIGIAAFILSVVRWIIIWFVKGTTWENNYGSDPLEYQNSSNGMYWFLWIILIVVNVVVCMINGVLNIYLFGDESDDSIIPMQESATEFISGTWESGSELIDSSVLQ